MGVSYDEYRRSLENLCAFTVSAGGQCRPYDYVCIHQTVGAIIDRPRVLIGRGFQCFMRLTGKWYYLVSAAAAAEREASASLLSASVFSRTPT